MKRLLRALVAVFLLTFSACQLTDYTLAKRSAIDKQIVAARAETESHLKALNDQQISLLQQSIAAHEAREQGASDYLVKASITFGGLKAPTRPELVMGQSVQQTATQLPAPSLAAQFKAYQDLRVELDETRISTEALKAQYETQLDKARVDGATKDKALTDLTTALKHVDDERVTVLTEAKDTEAELSDKRKAVDDAALAAKTKEANNAKSVQAIKLKMSSITGGLGLLCLLAAIYTPVFRQQIGIAAGVLLLTTVAIWYIQPYMVVIALGVGLLVLVGWAAKNHYIESKAATATYQALQSVKDTASADYDRLIKPALVAWQSKYLKDGTVVPDPSIAAHIDQRLMDTNIK